MPKPPLWVWVNCLAIVIFLALQSWIAAMVTGFWFCLNIGYAAGIYASTNFYEKKLSANIENAEKLMQQGLEKLKQIEAYESKWRMMVTELEQRILAVSEPSDKLH